MRKDSVPLPGLLLLPVVISLLACGSGDSPTEPVYRSGAQLLVVNSSSSSFWLRTYVGDYTSPLSEFLPTQRTEMHSVRAGSAGPIVLTGRFSVFDQPTVDAAGHGFPVGISYSVQFVISDPHSPPAIHLFLSRDSSGALAVTSDHPEAFRQLDISRS